VIEAGFQPSVSRESMLIREAGHGNEGAFGGSALYPLARYVNQTLAIWLKRKYKRFHHRLGRARLFLEKIARENRRLFVHWQLGVGDKLA
jgi:RNA-directed DNA polymerase